MAIEKTKIVIIGGGPGGYVAAIKAAQLGAAVTLVEKTYLGGTCLNVGCIPTKALLHTAEIYETSKEGAACGVIADVKLDFTAAQKYKSGITKQLVSGIKGLLAANKVKVIFGTASFEDAKTIKVITDKGATETLKADKVIVATGSEPAKPPIPGIDSKQCIDSTGALELSEVPKTMVIIGGGVIGVEMGSLYATLGTKVTIVEMLEEILPMMDRELTKILKAKMAAKGIEIFTEAKVVGIEDGGAEAKVSVAMKDGSQKAFSGEKVLISIGRRSNTGALNLDKAGIASERGLIKVNDKMETNVAGVYAIGDCNGRSMLAHVASAQGEVAAENAMGHESISSLKTNASCIYTNPEFASVGLTEEQAKAQGIDYVVGKFPLMANGKSLIMEAGDGMFKVIMGKEFKEVLGFHLLGPRATDLIAECALAIDLEATLDEFMETIHAHPTVAEAVREAVLAADKKAIHIPNK
ncbi:MAG: dihydrolipoamide dehydrogenase [Clostridiales bacterium]|jgi:dihydrolipoamide dehydrogenase|nr:dihydrolipoamide dehydrogenase [Clostridiales bacterium]